MKQMNMNMRKETVESYLQRGGTVTKIPQVLDTIGSIWNQQGYKTEQPEEIRVVSWKSIQPDERFDSEDDDRKYWKKLNKRCDQLLKKIKKEQNKT